MTDERRRELFDYIYRTYREDLQRFILSLSLRNVEDMEDIFQNTMEAVYKNLDKLRDEGKIKTWIFSIAKKEVNRYYSKKKKYKEPEDDGLYADIISMEELADAEDFVKDIVDMDEFTQLVNGLPNNMQSILYSHYYYDLSFVEISKIRKIKVNTIKSIHNRALAQIKIKLERRGVLK